ncbi:MAG: hypothetical protein LUD02_08760 [Tannerellaceae bacterium]|nr:hypothetical protein [Tannerellaceae bacterium]
MKLQLVNRRQAVRLRSLGFDWEVADFFVINSVRYFIPENMGKEENWNRFEETVSRPSIALAFVWLRNVYQCKCELTLKNWNKNEYLGFYLFLGMPEPFATKIFRLREHAERDLLTRMLEYISVNY